MGATFSITAQYDQVARVCAFVADAAAAAGFAADEVFRLELACDEACTNVIEHAYGGEASAQNQIHINCDTEADNFVITIHDHGKPFDPAAVPPPNIPTKSTEITKLQVGGLGLPIIRKIMDDVQFSFKGRAGNTLRMIKRLPEKK